MRTIFRSLPRLTSQILMKCTKFNNSKWVKNYQPIRSMHIEHSNSLSECPKTKIETSKKTSIYNLSDLHLEYYQDPNILHHNIEKILPIETSNTKTDVLVLAGDIGYPMGEHGDNYLFLLDRFKQKFNQVILVPGNHEYYQTKDFNRNEIIDKLNIICKKTSCHLLNNQSIELYGIQFIGTTLWTDIDPQLKHIIFDGTKGTKGKTFNIIFKDFEAYQNEFQKCMIFLRDQLAIKHNKKIIITHHIPSYSLQHSKYKMMNLNYDSMFYSEILELLDLTNVKYWFCGHTHEAGSIVHGNTQIILNPIGTHWEQSKRHTKVSNNILLI